MAFFRKIFGKKETKAEPALKPMTAQTGGSKPAAKTWMEKDNLGTRHETLSFASGYWVARMTSSQKDPFVLYDFDSEDDARQALLELPCIKVAADTGKLICTQVLIYGYYPSEGGKYEAILCGSDLSHGLWEQAKASFIKHGGKPKGQGELEPELNAAPPVPAAKAQPGKVVFVKEERQSKMGATFIYRIYKGPDAASAQEFLQQNPVNKQLFYIIVETPEGNYCRDIQGIYKE